LFASAVMLIAAGLSAALAFGFVVYTARTLGPVAYADVTAVLSLIYLVSHTVSPVLQAVAHLVARFGARGDADAIAGVAAMFGRAAVRIGGSVAVVALLLSPSIASVLRLQSSLPAMLGVLMLFEYLFWCIGRGVLQGEGRVVRDSLIVVAEAALRLTFAVIALHFLRTAAAAMAAYALAQLVAVLLLPWHRAREKPDPGLVRDALTFLGPVFVASLLFAVSQNIDVLLAKRLFPAATSGTYAAAAFIAKAIGAAAVPFHILALPHITRIREGGGDAVRSARRLLLAFMAVGTLLLLTVALFGPALVRVLYGEAFAAAAPLLLPVSAATLAAAIGYLAVQALAARRDFRFLRTYGVLVALQCVALALFHDTPLLFARVLLVSQLAVVTGLLIEARVALGLSRG
jgi:O-antigen/teichoic acid export membrane protein